MNRKYGAKLLENSVVNTENKSGMCVKVTGYHPTAEHKHRLVFVAVLYSLKSCCVLQGGCITKLEQFLADHLLIIGAVGIGVACLQVMLWLLKLCNLSTVCDCPQLLVILTETIRRFFLRPLFVLPADSQFSLVKRQLL